MDKSTRTEADRKPAVTLINATWLGMLDGFPPAAYRLLLFLADKRWHWHAHSPAEWQEALRISKATYYRVLGWMEREGMIEVCVDRECHQRPFGPTGWRLTDGMKRWLGQSLSRETKQSRQWDDLVSFVAPTVVTNMADYQGESSGPLTQEGEQDEQVLLPQPGPAVREGETMKNQPEEWGPALGDDDKPAPRGKSPSTRIRLAFQEMARKDYWNVPVTSSVARMMSNIKWMLNEGYSEGDIIESFGWFKNISHRYALGPENPVWEVYFRHRGGLIKQAIKGRAGNRPGQEYETLAQQGARNRERWKNAGN